MEVREAYMNTHRTWPKAIAAYSLPRLYTVAMFVIWYGNMLHSLSICCLVRLVVSDVALLQMLK